MNRQSEDIELIRRCKTDDQKAYANIFNHYYPQMYNYIYSIVKNDMAEDLTMVTFEKAFKDLDKYQPFFTFRTWIIRIGKNTALDYLSYRKSYRRIKIVDLEVLPGIEFETPEHRLITHQNLEAFNYTLRNIPISHRRVFEMFNDGISCKDIAKRLNLSLGSVLSRIRYVRKWLTEILLKKQTA